ncbi:MAG TPA: (Fe-S)-binding protein [Actinomycetota bacterium]
METGVRIAIGMAIIGVALGFASIRIKYLVELALRGRRDPERFTNMFTRVNAHNVKVLGQKKLLQWTLPGTLHALTFWGFLIVQITLIESIGEIFDREFELPVVGDHAWLGFIQDLFFTLVTIALVGFMIIRLRTRPKKLERRSRFYGSHLGAAYFILFMIFNVIWTVALARGARGALGTLPYEPHQWAFVSNGIGILLQDLSTSALHRIEDTALLMHVAVVFGFLLIVLHSKHMHIFTSPLNVLFGRQPIALGALRPLEIDMENMTEETSFGAGKVEDFSWKNILDMYTCTECGRCQSVCPAWNTGKTLNPKFIITASRDHLFEKAPYLLGQKEWDPNAPGADDPEHVMNKQLVGDVHLDESIFACTTCGACVYECPVDIEHVDQIIDMRRYAVMMESRFPSEAGLMLRNLESSGNPWGEASGKRLDWTKGLEDDIVVMNGRIPADVEYLYWVGCAGAFDDRAKKSVRAFAEIMIAADVSFAILGTQESCTGDPARRIGNEYLFQEIAKTNIEQLHGKGVRKIVASCPHCFNTIAREYPQLGGNFEVIHHSELLARLIDEGKITPNKTIIANVAYHDPCYLARHNDVIEQPRHVIESIPGVVAREAHRCGKKTFCCGAGGARMWMEESTGKRVNIERTEELLETNPDIVSTGCPYCLIMLDDGQKELVAQGKSREGIKIMDVAQVLRDAMDISGFERPAQPVAVPRGDEA